MSFRPGDPLGAQTPFPRASLTDAVVDAVRAMVRDGRLTPGELYSVQQLADALGVSRSPAREGLLRLAESGLVSFERNRGFRVAVPDGRDLAEIFALRLALEPDAAARVAAQVAARAAEQPVIAGEPGAVVAGESGAVVAEESVVAGEPGAVVAEHPVVAGEPGAVVAEHPVVAELSAALAAMRAAAAAGDEPAYWGQDRRLHQAILGAAGNRRAARIVEDLRRTTWLLGSRTTGTRTLQDITAEHEPVVAAICAGLPAVARAAMRGHLERTGRLLVAQALGRAPEDAEVEDVWRSVAGSG